MVRSETTGSAAWGFELKSSWTFNPDSSGEPPSGNAAEALEEVSLSSPIHAVPARGFRSVLAQRPEEEVCLTEECNGDMFG